MPQPDPARNWPESDQVAEACAQLLTGRPIGRLLDAGGGTGFLTRYLMTNHPVDAATVLDRRPDPLASVLPPIETKLGLVEHLDASDGQFRTILMRQVLHYIHYPVRALRRLRDRLQPDGAMYVGQMVAPDAGSARWLASAANWVSPERHRVWTADRLLATFGRAGLRVERGTVLPHWQALTECARPDVARMSDPVRRAMPVRDRPGDLTCRIFWLHALLVPDAVPEWESGITQ